MLTVSLFMLTTLVVDISALFNGESSLNFVLTKKFTPIFVGTAVQ